MKRLLGFALLAAACGPKSPATATTPTGSADSAAVVLPDVAFETLDHEQPGPRTQPGRLSGLPAAFSGRHPRPREAGRFPDAAGGPAHEPGQLQVLERLERNVRQ